MVIKTVSMGNSRKKPGTIAILIHTIGDEEKTRVAFATGTLRFDDPRLLAIVIENGDGFMGTTDETVDGPEKPAEKIAQYFSEKLKLKLEI